MPTEDLILKELMTIKEDIGSLNSTTESLSEKMNIVEKTISKSLMFKLNKETITVIASVVCVVIGIPIVF